MLKELLLKNRSYRRFYQHITIDNTSLLNWIDNSRLGASGRNAQSLKYKIVNHTNDNQKVFECLKWAGYLTNWEGPVEGEKPAAYILIYNDENISKNYFCDDGIAIQNILLSAVEEGFGGCIIKVFDAEKLKRLFPVQENLIPIEILALGKPKEQVIITEMKNNDIKYWRDEKEIHYVPKRKLDDILL